MSRNLKYTATIGKIGVSEEKKLQREKALKLTHTINQLSPLEVEKRNRLFRKLFAKTPERFHIEPPFRCDYGDNIRIGEDFFANFNCTILDCRDVIIGDRVLLGPNVVILSVGHPIDATARNAMIGYSAPVAIGNDVWIGANAVINQGVVIGNNVVIGSGSVVTRSIPDNVVAAGNPCRVLRPIGDQDRAEGERFMREIEQLEKTAAK